MDETKPLPIGRILFGTALLFVSVHFCFSIDWKAGAGFLIGVPAFLLILLIPPKRAPYFLLCYIAMCFVVADRTVYIGDVFRLYPQELLTFLLLLYLAFTQGKVSGKSLVPVGGKVVAALTLFGIYTAMNERQSLEIAFFYAKGILIFLPIFFCVRRVVTSERTLLNVSTFLVAAAVVGSLMNIADFHGLGIAKGIFGETEKEVYMDLRTVATFQIENPFHRIAGLHVFSVFTAASIYLIFFLTLYLYHNFKTLKFRLFLRAAQLILLVYIYYSGYRSIWIALTVSLLLYGIHRGAKGIVGLALLVILVVAVLPASVTDRLQGLGVQSEEERDSSVQKRMDRVENATQMVREKPFLGAGWGAAGLVHNEFLQIAADSGVGTVIAFLFFYGGILARLYSRYWYALRQGRRLESHCMNVFFSALSGYLVIWATGSHFNTQHTFFIFWLTLAFGANLRNLQIGEGVSVKPSLQVRAAA